MRGKRSSDDLVKMVYKMLDDGKTPYRITKLTGIPASTVKDVVRRRVGATANQVKHVLGRPRRTNARQDRHLIFAIKQNRETTPIQHLDSSGIHLSVGTVRNRIKQYKLHVRNAVVDVLTRQQKTTRMIWCNEHLFDDFSNVIFSDETTFQLRKNKKYGRHRIYRTAKEKFSKTCIITSPNVVEQGSVTAWACFSSAGFGCMRIIRRTMNADLYIDTLTNYLLPSVDMLVPPGEPYYFMQDNAPCHTAGIVRTWLNNHNVPLLPWPPYSPDINPIENVWGLIKRRIRNNLPTNLARLEVALHNAWTSLQLPYAANLANSVPLRLRSIIGKHGLRI